MPNKLRGYIKVQGSIGSPFYPPEVRTWLANIAAAGL
jgi:hypothetical protein